MSNGSRLPFRLSRLIVTPVKTGVHPHPRNLDTVFQRYDGPSYRLKTRDINHP